MSKLRRYPARYPQSKTDEYLRKHPERHGDSTAVSEPGVVKMQHMIGNQAVQRLIQREIPATSKVEIQRDSGDKTEEGPRTYALATIVLSTGKLEGKSKLSDHDGKLEITSINQDTDRAGNIEITFTRVSDELSAKFQEAAAKGIAVESAKFEILRHGGPESKINHVMDFANGHISSFQVSTHEGVASESITITFGPAKTEDDD